MWVVGSRLVENSFLIKPSNENAWMRIYAFKVKTDTLKIDLFTGPKTEHPVN